MTIIYCTTDPTRWGSGVNRLLFNYEVDRNFFDLDSRTTALEDHILSGTAAGIESISVSDNNQMFVTLTNSVVLGPFTLPTASFTWRGTWQPTTSYNVNDLFYAFGSIYMVLIAHTSASSFDPGANLGPGQNLYQLFLTIPAVPVYAVSAATFTPGLNYTNSYTRFTHPGGCIISIATNASVAFQIATELHFRDATESGSGIFIEALSGVTINVPHGYMPQSAVVGATIGLKKVDTDEWDMFGLLAQHP